MNPTIDILRAELERLFSLDEMTSMSSASWGSTRTTSEASPAKASFARALAERCVDGDRIDALIDVHSRVARRDRPARPRRRGPRKPTSCRRAPRWALRDRPQARRERARDRVPRAARRHSRLRAQGAAARGVARPARGAALPHGEAHGRGGRAPGAADGARRRRDGRRLLGELRLLRRAAAERALRAIRAVAHLRSCARSCAASSSRWRRCTRARVTHGDLKLENVLVGRSAEGAPSITLIDFGTDRLRQRTSARTGTRASSRSSARPRRSRPSRCAASAPSRRRDVYAFGAMMYELLSGKPVFAFDNATEAAFAHVDAQRRSRRAPSAPRGWVTRDVDQFVLRSSRRSRNADRATRRRSSTSSSTLGRGPASVCRRAGMRSPKRR